MRRTVKTVSLNRAIEIFRNYGIPIGNEKLIAMIDSGEFRRFAFSSRTEKSKKVQRIIFEKPLIDWLESMAEEVEG